jgi:phosphate transport system substrate-binding protein
MLHRGALSAIVAMLLVAAVVICGCPKPDADAEGGTPASGPARTKAADSKGTEAKGSDTGATAGASSIQCKGSDTLLHVAQGLAERYKDVEPGVDVTVTGGGSGTGFQALIEGTTDIADASRQIKDQEKKACEEKGITPKENTIGYDGIAVIVNKDNPVSELTIQQLSDIYVGDTTEWDKVGGKGEIVLYSRDSTSGTYEYFREHVVQLGGDQKDREYAATASMLQSNPAILEQVAASEGAVGYVGLGYLNDTVKAVAIIGESGPVLPSVETVLDGTYPISRPLFMYTTESSPERVTKFMQWVLGKDGQDIVAEKGFVRLQAK